MSGVDDFIDEMNMLIQEIRRLKKENVELQDQIEFDNGKLGGFC
jgi:cell division septum initiation protein DivIVA